MMSAQHAQGSRISAFMYYSGCMYSLLCWNYSRFPATPIILKIILE